MPGGAPGAASRRKYVHPLQDSPVCTLGWEHDSDVKNVIRRALKDAWPAASRYGWQVNAVHELEPDHEDVGYLAEDGILYIKVRRPQSSKEQQQEDAEAAKGASGGKGGLFFYAYAFILATVLHELTHLSFLGHGKAFYRCLHAAVRICGTEWPAALRQQVHKHVCAELLNAVCENDHKRARALLDVMPEAASCPRPGSGPQLPLEYAAHHGRVALTALLLEARADVEACCGAGVPPLARAVAQGNAKTAKILLAAGAAITAVEPSMRGKLLSPSAAAKPASLAEEGARLVAGSSSLQKKQAPAPRSVQSVLSTDTTAAAVARTGWNF